MNWFLYSAFQLPRSTENLLWRRRGLWPAVEEGWRSELTGRHKGGKKQVHRTDLIRKDFSYALQWGGGDTMGVMKCLRLGQEPETAGEIMIVKHCWTDKHRNVHLWVVCHSPCASLADSPQATHCFVCFCCLCEEAELILSSHPWPTHLTWLPPADAHWPGFQPLPKVVALSF